MLLEILQKFLYISYLSWYYFLSIDNLIVIIIIIRLSNTVKGKDILESFNCLYVLFNQTDFKLN